MKKPQQPPDFDDILLKLSSERLAELISLPLEKANEYLHWDKLRRHPLPASLQSYEEWWAKSKLARFPGVTLSSLQDNRGALFQFVTPPFLQEKLHELDLNMGGRLTTLPELRESEESRTRYIINSLMEEAITSSQLEGAATTREIAKEMIRSRRPPRDRSEQMILNNYRTMQEIRELNRVGQTEKLTPELILHIHKLVTDGTLDKPDAAGRFRMTDEPVDIIDDRDGTILHTPPKADELEQRIDALCAFANGDQPQMFIHPVIRAITLHFYFAYIHPFVDGNGRTARALFYWAMLRAGYWMFEYISISTILRKAPAKYSRAFLYTETDDNDLTYFIVHQIGVIDQAQKALHQYLERKSMEARKFKGQIKSLSRLFNPRQVALLTHALNHPGHEYTVESHKGSHGIVTQTARTDLVSLVNWNLLEQHSVGRKAFYLAPNDLQIRLEDLELKYQKDQSIAN